MCWFSEMHPILLRQVVEGEELIVGEFKGLEFDYQGNEIWRRWFSSPGKTKEAVCLNDGCCLKLNNSSGMLGKEITIESEPIVRFAQTLRDKPTLSFWEELFRLRTKLGRVIARDVLVFNNGTLFPVVYLPIGLKADVLSPYVSGQDQVPEIIARARERKPTVT